jgi:hypothetical protein
MSGDGEKYVLGRSTASCQAARVELSFSLSFAAGLIARRTLVKAIREYPRSPR